MPSTTTEALAHAELAHRCNTDSLANAVDRWFASDLPSHGRTASSALSQWRRSKEALAEAQAAHDLATMCSGCGETDCNHRDCDQHLYGDDERADLATRAA